MGERTVPSMTLPKFSQPIDRCLMRCSHRVVNAKKHLIFNASPRQSPHTHGYSHSERCEATVSELKKKKRDKKMEWNSFAESSRVVRLNRGKCEVHC